MKILNSANEKIVADKVKVADTVISRFIGLLNRKSFEEGEGLLIVPCNSIHSFGMKFSFDAVFLDKSNKVRFVIKNMHPWKVSPVIFNVNQVLELPAGTIERAEINIGDTLKFNE